MSLRLKSLFFCEAVALLVWFLIPSTGIDRAFFSLTAKVFEKSEHFITGKGTSEKPFKLHTMRATPPDITGKLPLDIVISDDAGKVFQTSPPSPVDFAVILKNLRRMGRDSVAIGMPLSWINPDVISLTALDQQLEAFSAVITCTPLSRNPVPAPIPPAFRRASLPISSIIGDSSLLPIVNHIPIPDVVLGNKISLAGFTTLESESPTGSVHMLARWDDRAVFSFPLLAALSHFHIKPSAITIRLGEWISLGSNGPFIPVDKFGLFTIQPPMLPLADMNPLHAETLIDAPDDFLSGIHFDPALIRSGLTAADPVAAAYSDSLIPTLAILSDPEGTSQSRNFPTLQWPVELLLIASTLSLLYGFGNYPLLSGKWPLLVLVFTLLVLHFILVPITSTWLPTLPLIACALTALPCAMSRYPSNAKNTEEEPFPRMQNRKKKRHCKNASKASSASDYENNLLHDPSEKASTETNAPLISPTQPESFTVQFPLSHMNPAEKAEALIEALPYLQAFRSKTIVIKMGGSAMENPELVARVMRDIVFLEVAGINPIVVHGGGKAISAAMEKAGIEAKFSNGLRYTSEEAIGIVSKVLSDEINPGLVRMIRDLNGKAIGISGTDIFLGEKMKATDNEGNPVDLGRVGEVIGCQLANMDIAHKAGIIPVISPLATELSTGKPLNINADLAAAALAKELRAFKLVYLSDVPGLLADAKDPSTLIKSINRAQAEALIADGTISGGMIPKVLSAVDALNAGVRKVHFIDGRLPHALLLEIFTDGGIGTEVIR